MSPYLGRCFRIVSALVILAALLQPVLPVRAQANPPQAGPAGWAAFVRDNDIVLMALDGSQTRVLMEIPAQSEAGRMTFSPDGRWLVFKVDKTDYLYDISNDRTQTLGDVNYTQPAWSPDSQKLIFTVDQCLKVLDIASQQTLTITCETYYDPFWPAGSDRLFLTNYDSFYTVDLAEGSQPQVFLTRSQLEALMGTYLQLSPSGTYVGYKCCSVAESFGNGPPFYTNDFALQTRDNPLNRQIIQNITDCEWRPNDRLICYGYGEIKTINAGSGVVSSLPVTQADAYFGIRLNYLTRDETTIYGESVTRWPVINIIRHTPQTGVEILTQGWFTSISPNEDFLVLSRADTLYIYNLATGAETLLSGHKPNPLAISWAGAGEAVNLEEWLGRKREAIDSLTSPQYEWLLGLQTPANLPAIDESGASAIVGDWMENPQGVTPEEIEAFQRLTLQEEALAEIQKDFMILVDDEASSALDYFNTFFSMLMFIRAGNLGGSAGRFQYWLRNSFEDSTRLIVYLQPDLEKRDQARNLFDTMLILLFDAANFSDPGEFLRTLGPELLIRLFVARMNHADWVEEVQPQVNRGVNSITRADDPMWVVTENTRLAEMTTEYLTNVSQNFQEAAHTNYLEIRRGLDAAQLMIDIADAASLATGRVNAYVIFFQLWTRFQHMLVNFYSQFAYVYPAKECSLDMALHSGRQAFQPDVQGVPDCDWRVGRGQQKEVLQSTSGVDAAAWEAFRQVYEPVLADYEAVMQPLQAKIASGDPLTSRDLEALDGLLARLEDAIDQGFEILQPQPGAAWDEQTLGVARSLLEMETQTTALLLAFEIPAETLQEPQVLEAVQQTFNEAQTVLEKNRQTLADTSFSGPAAGIALFSGAPAVLPARPGASLEIPFTLKNIGSAPLEAGILMVELNQVEVSRLETPRLEPGQEIRSIARLSAPEQLPAEVKLTLSAGSSTGSQRVSLTADNPAQAASGSNRVVGGLLSLAGGILVLAAGILIYRRIVRKN